MHNAPKLLSLFDGSGGFPLAAFLCGIQPRYASEVEPYPIAVTRSRFPNMEHLGDVSKVSGAEIEPVDVVAFGSPCQDLSVAGKQAGLKHEANGDEETTRSGLFMEAVRIIKEMREKTNGLYPTFAIWENVPGAFSSNGGRDFRVVLEELIKIVEPSAVMPPIPKGGWNYADCFVGDGWSLAYRVLDAQYIRTAQRRKRIYLVLDLRGERALQVLFERESLQGCFATCRKSWEAAPPHVEGGINATNRAYGVDGYNGSIDAVASTLGVNCGVSTCRNAVCYKADDGSSGLCAPTLVGAHNSSISDHTALVVYNVDPIGIDVYNQACTGSVAKSLTAKRSDSDHTPCVAYGLDRASFNQGQNAKYDFSVIEDQQPTLTAKGPGAVSAPPHYIVRRLTPTECARLQGFPDKWGDIDHKGSLTDDEYDFWCDVRKTFDEINGAKPRYMTKEKALKWYNNLHTDAAEYKMWGNGIALPCALYVMQGVAEALRKEDN